MNIQLKLKGMRTLKITIYLLLLAVYAFFCYLMAAITMQYIPINTDVAFLRIKQEYVTMIHYSISFFIHVFTSIFVLIAGFTQFSKTIRQKYYWIHQSSGWLYVVATLLFAAPSGLIIGIYANGGFWSRIGFCLLAVLWFIFTLVAMWRLKQKNIIAHQQWMLRSFALAMSAITLRAWKYIIVAIFHPPPMDVYRVVAWLGWVLNLVIVEVYIYRKWKG